MLTAIPLIKYDSMLEKYTDTYTGLVNLDMVYIQSIEKYKFTRAGEDEEECKAIIIMRNNTTYLIDLSLEQFMTILIEKNQINIEHLKYIDNYDKTFVNFIARIASR